MGGYLVFKSVEVPTAPEVEGVSDENARRWHVVDGVQIVAWSRGQVAPIIRLRGVHERACASRGAEEENHAEGAPVAAAVIAAFSSGSAEYRRVEMGAVRGAASGWGRGAGRGLGQAAPLVRQRVPDDEVQSHREAPAWGWGGEEGAAVAAVEGEPAREVAGGGAAEGGVDKLEAGAVGYGVAQDAEEAADVGRRV